MEEEIFGPVTPLCSYDSLDDVIARLNAGASPLASYIASHDQMAAQKFVEIASFTPSRPTQKCRAPADTSHETCSPKSPLVNTDLVDKTQSSRPPDYVR